MPDTPKITVEELKQRMDAGQHLTIIDTRNPRAWEDADTTLPGAIRVTADDLKENLKKIPKKNAVVAYCT